jgi:hypothetical protein
LQPERRQTTHNRQRRDVSASMYMNQMSDLDEPSMKFKTVDSIEI